MAITKLKQGKRKVYGKHKQLKDSEAYPDEFGAATADAMVKYYIASL